jgi:hypothetical protein
MNFSKIPIQNEMYFLHENRIEFHSLGINCRKYFPLSTVALEKLKVAQPSTKFTFFRGIISPIPWSQEQVTESCREPEESKLYASTIFYKNQFIMILQSAIRSWSRDSVVGISTGYGLDDRGVEFESRYDQEFSLLQSSRPALGSTQPLIRWVRG